MPPLLVYPENMSYHSRITIDPSVCHGKPSVRGMRYPVELILQLLASGMSSKDILEDYPDLVKEDIQACLEFAAKLADVKGLTPALS